MQNKVPNIYRLKLTQSLFSHRLKTFYCVPEENIAVPIYKMVMQREKEPRFAIYNFKADARALKHTLWLPFKDRLLSLIGLTHHLYPLEG